MRHHDSQPYSRTWSTPPSYSFPLSRFLARASASLSQILVCGALQIWKFFYLDLLPTGSAKGASVLYFFLVTHVTWPIQKAVKWRFRGGYM